MNDGEITKMWVIAKRYAERMGMGDEAEDFAQDAVLRLYGGRKATIEQLFIDYCGYLGASKRVLGSPEGKFSKFRTVSLDAPIDSSDSDSSKLGDLVGDTRFDPSELRQLDDDIELIERIIGLCRKPEAVTWAMNVYVEYLSEHI